MDTAMQCNSKRDASIQEENLVGTPSSKLPSLIIVSQSRSTQASVVCNLIGTNTGCQIYWGQDFEDILC